MARVLGLLPSALRAAADNMGANNFYRYLRQIDVAPRRTEALQLYKMAIGMTTGARDEIFANPARVPSGSELVPFPSKKATGVRQNVTLIYRDRVTGTLQKTYWSVTSENGISRESAMSSAIDAYAPHAEAYEQDLIGAVHTGAYRYVPFASIE